jgi:hypothetical protein
MKDGACWRRMPRHVDRPLPPARALAEALLQAGAQDVPTAGDEARLQGILWMAGYLRERQKGIAFPGFTWDDPRFVATDAKARVEVAYAPLQRADDLREVLLGVLPRVRDITLLGLDARESGLKEFELEHLLWGQVTLYAFPRKPEEPMDRRVHEARERGWGATLKAHNLLPGRGIVVLDEHHGLMLTEPALAALPGLLVLLPGGDTHLWWNPFCPTLDPEMEHYLAWGAGTGRASEWREVLRYEGEDE